MSIALRSFARRAIAPRFSVHLRTARRSLATVTDDFDPMSVERATDEVDVCIVGGGPAGLCAAIRLKQLEAEKGNEIRVVVLEKGAEVGE
jgi:electron-transferring-flavoprotein dehydrogenase